MNIHIGKLVLDKLKERGISKSEFARRINKSRQNVQDIFKRQSLDTQLLSEIGEVLTFDFFSALSKKPPKDDKLVADLKKEIAYLKKINSLLEKKKNVK